MNYPHLPEAKFGFLASTTDAFPPSGLLVLLRLGAAITGFPPPLDNSRIPSVLMFGAALPQAVPSLLFW